MFICITTVGPVDSVHPFNGGMLWSGKEGKKEQLASSSTAGGVSCGVAPHRRWIMKTESRLQHMFQHVATWSADVSVFMKVIS
jgi:hypothetical protein